MLSGKGKEKGERTTMGLISKKATLHVQRTFLYIFLPLFCTTTIWNFQKLPSYTFYGGNVVRVLAVPDTDLEIRDWGQSSKPLEKGGWGRSPKNSKKFFSALRASVWYKNKGEPGPLPWIRHFLALFFFSLSLIFTLGGREHISFSHRRYKIFMLFFQQKTTLLFFLSLAYFLFISVFLFSYILNSWTWQSIDNTDTETISAFRFRLYLPFSCLCYTRREWLCDFPPK